MHRNIRTGMLIGLATLLALNPLPAFAKGKGDGGGKPKGFEKGEKKGWGEGEMPPGLAKKAGESGDESVEDEGKSKKKGKGKGKGKDKKDKKKKKKGKKDKD